MKIFLVLLILLIISIILNFCAVLIAILFIIYFIFYQVINFFRSEPVNGTLNEILELKMDAVIIKQKKYLINEIKRIEIDNSDIKGDFIYFQISFQPHFSNGTNNSIKLILNSGEKVNCAFQQTKNEKISYNRRQLINYYQKGKISWLALLDLLEITDYDEIQEFKKKINNEKVS